MGPFTQNPPRGFKQQKGRKCDPGLITAGAAISENGEHRADKEVSVLLPVGCFVRCERLNVSLCVKMNCLCSEVTALSDRQRNLYMGTDMSLHFSFFFTLTHFSHNAETEEEQLR